jgi:hypothetical protein
VIATVLTGVIEIKKLKELKKVWLAKLTPAGSCAEIEFK